jgi:type IV pilus assembly protein PilV
MTEVMVAIVILMVGMLGLLQSINLAIDVNLRNNLRNEAVYLGESEMNKLKGRGFDNISASYASYYVTSKIRGTSRNFSVQKSSTVLSTVSLLPAAKQLTVVVSWTYKGTPYENRVIAPISILR